MKDGKLTRVIGVALAILITAGGAAVFIQKPVLDSRIDIGLDLSLRPAESPRIACAGAGMTVAMEPISALFTPSNVTARFQLSVPRRALLHPGLNLQGVEPSTIVRLYVGSFVPEVYSTSPQVPGHPWGIRHVAWVPVVTANGIQINSMSPLEKSLSSAFFTLFFILSCSVAIGLAMLVGLTRLISALIKGSAITRTLGPREPRSVRIALIAVPCSVWLIYLALFFPGAMSYDSLQQWEQAHQLVFNHYFAPFHTLIVRLLTLAWDSPAAVALAQILLLAFSLGAAYHLLLRARVSRYVVFGILLISAFSPMNGCLSVTLWKDVPFAAIFCLFVTVLAQGLLDSEQPATRSFWIKLGILSGALCLLRHNGAIAVIGTLIFLPFAFWAHRRKIWPGLISLLLIVGTWKTGIEPRLAYRQDEIPVKPLYTIWYSLGRTAFYVDQDVPFTETEYEFLNLMRPRWEDRWAFNPCSAVSAITDRYVDYSYATKHVDQLRDFFIALVVRYPLPTVYNQWLCNTSLFVPFHPPQEWVEGPWMKINDNEFGLRHRPISWRAYLILDRWVTWTASPKWSWLFWRAALPLYLSFIAALIVIRKSRDWRFFIIYWPFVLNTAGIFLITLSQEKRYQFPLLFSLGFLLALALIPFPAPKEKKPENLSTV